LRASLGAAIALLLSLLRFESPARQQATALLDLAMRSWRPTLREGLIAGSVASALSVAALLVAGQKEPQRPAAPVNAISHWIWGDHALRQDEPTLRHTASGYLIHHVASVFWAVLHARAWGERPEAKRPLPALAGAVVTSGLACFVDFQMTPKRLTPGFEHRLSRPALAGVYACFAIGLALGSLLAARGGPTR
jgi:hypothetical protein